MRVLLALLVVGVVIACASALKYPTGERPGACVRVFNDSDEYLKVRVEPSGTLLGRVQAVSAKTFYLRAYPLGSSFLTATPALGNGTDRYSPRFTFSHSLGWRWKIEARLGHGYSNHLEQDLWPLASRHCARKRVR